MIAASPEQVATYQKGKTSTLGWFVGQVMKKTGGKANPGVVNALLKKALDSLAVAAPELRPRQCRVHVGRGVRRTSAVRAPIQSLKE